MANEMLHRGPINRLTATMSNMPVVSTCLLLLLQSQIFHALPTSSSSTLNDDLRLLDNHSAQGASASSQSSSYQPTYSYSSYRPGTGLDSYRPYRDYYPKENAAPAGLYIGESAHPNSVYSPESILTRSPQNQEKVLQYIEKELADQQPIKVTLKTDKDQVTAEKNDRSSPVVLPRRRNNKPRLAPLPSVPEFKKEHVVKNEKQLESLPNPIPPPFAPELDPQYERRQYGLGALTLLEQAGPFW